MDSLPTLLEIDEPEIKCVPVSNKQIVETHLSNIRNLIDSKNRDVSNNLYTGFPLNKCNDETLITHLESTYILLLSMNDRLTTLENSGKSLDHLSGKSLDHLSGKSLDQT
jgi:hypothetical protein